MHRPQEPIRKHICVGQIRSRKGWFVWHESYVLSPSFTNLPAFISSLEGWCQKVMASAARKEKAKA